MVKVIKESAEQGYTGHLMNVLKVKDDYTRRRLNDERILEKIKELLGDGFKVEYHLTYSRHIITGEDLITNKQIQIKWE